MGKLEEKSIRIIEFTGEKSDWRIWSRKFLARANRKGYKDVIVGKEHIPTLSEYDEAVALESQTEDSESTIAAYKNNPSPRAAIKIMEEEADEVASLEGGAEAEANSETVIVIKSPVVVASG